MHEKEILHHVQHDNLGFTSGEGVAKDQAGAGLRRCPTKSGMTIWVGRGCSEGKAFPRRIPFYKPFTF